MAYDILLIESSEADRKDIGTFLESLGYSLSYAATSKEGLLQFEKLRPDLTIVEVLLSGNMNGLQICKSIKGEADWAKVIVTSKLYRSSSMARDAVDKYRADVYLEKPFQMKDLYDHIQNLIGMAPLPEDSKLAGGKYQMAEPPEAEAPAPKPDSAPPPKKRRERPARPEPKKPAAQAEPLPLPAPEPVAVKSSEPGTGQKPCLAEDMDDDDDFDSKPPRPAVSDRPPAPPSAPPPNIPAEGEVDRENLGRLLHELFAGKVNGVLILEYPEGSKHIFTVDGMPVFVQSNIRKESLGQILVSGGHISQDQYQSVLEEAASTKKKIGAICVRQGLLSSKQLHQILTDQTAIKVANCFAWETGRYKLDLTRTYPKNAPIFEASPAQIILRAHSDYYPMEILEGRFEREKDKIVFAGKENVYQGLKEVLSERQRAFLESADGKLSLQDMIDLDRLSRTEGIRLAFALLAMGVFKLGSIKRDKELDNYSPEPALEPLSDPDREKTMVRINEMYIRLENEDHFQVLGVERGVSETELTEHYQELKALFHSAILGDQAPRAQTEKLEAINRRLDEAYRRLCSPQDRRDYIRSLEGASERPAVESEMILDRAERDNPPLAGELAFQKGQFAMDRGKYHAAVDYFDRACTLEPNAGDYHIRLGYAKFLKATAPREPLDEAYEDIQKGLRLAPGNIFALRALAEIERYRGNLQAAADLLKRVLKADPENDEAELELSEIRTLLEKGIGRG